MFDQLFAAMDDAFKKMDDAFDADMDNAFKKMDDAFDADMDNAFKKMDDGVEEIREEETRPDGTHIVRVTKRRITKTTGSPAGPKVC